MTLVWYQRSGSTDAHLAAPTGSGLVAVVTANGVPTSHLPDPRVCGDGQAARS